MLSAERNVAKKLNIKPCALRNKRLQGAIGFVKIRGRYFIQKNKSKNTSARKPRV